MDDKAEDKKRDKATAGKAAGAAESAPAISRHKWPSTRQPAAATGGSQAFDIIPPSRVMPSSSARPVVMSDKPQQSDNTLTAAPPRRSQRILLANKPGVEVDDDGVLKLPPLPIEEPVEDAPANASVEAVDKADKPDGTGPPIAAAQPEADAGLEGVEHVLQPANAEPADASADDQASKAAAEQAAAEEQIARALAGESQVDDSDSPVADAAHPEADDMTDAQPAQKEPVAGPQPAATGPDKAEPIHKDDSVAAVLAAGNRETQATPQAHTPALKDALDNLEDQPQHHELYGGKPVIVIHKARGSRSTASTVAWVIICLLLAIVIVDLLIDANIISLSYDIPHTNFL